jgi:hypothetical protein
VSKDNVSRLHAIGVRFTPRMADHDIVVTCPSCGGQLIFDEDKPHWLCLRKNFEINRLTFDGVIRSMSRADRQDVDGSAGITLCLK